MSDINLNLTRKWRSKSFDQIVGQELSVRMLKNSLYLNQYFPVYLFSGQRGCGKTSTARVFAAAINCSQLKEFRKSPKKKPVPCLTCPSCIAVMEGNHPDFIEIDAASYTGVDNVRQIIEASSFLPVMGDKKIYLIDEAHMLSKAAFNAFLKILEEPPSSVLFILATTNPQKIIDTVRSRCFQLFFKAVSYLPLLDHLKSICKKEAIAYEEPALGLIIKETDGSVRDSLNLLEQVRFSSARVDKSAVQHVLGHIDDDQLLVLFELLLSKGPKDILMFLRVIDFEHIAAPFIWKKVIEMVRAAIWVKHGVEPTFFVGYADAIKKMVAGCSWEQLHTMLEFFYDNEHLFKRTTAKHSLLEMILIQISQKNDVSNKSGASAAPQVVAASDEVCDDGEEFDEEEDEIEEDEMAPASEKNEWDRFLDSLDDLNDPFVSSIFKNGEFVRFDKATGKLEVEFPKKYAFFEDSFEETKVLWSPLIKKQFLDNAVFVPLFTSDKETAPTKKNYTNQQDVDVVEPRIEPAAKKQGSSYRPAMHKTHSRMRQVAAVKGKVIDVSDTVAWKTTNTLLQYFAGTIREIQES